MLEILFICVGPPFIYTTLIEWYLDVSRISIS